MAINIAIIDYGMGNLHSVYNKLYMLNANPVIATTPHEILKADKIILPGVGHFEKANNNLKSLGMTDILNEVVLVKRKHILGICLGMQLFANESEEGKSPGFGWINTKVKRFIIQNNKKHKVPQTGWNTVNTCKESNLFKNIDAQSEFYFLHAYHYDLQEEEYILAITEYEYEFISAIEQENIFGTQFHPEKSHDSGIQLLKNFIHL